MIGTSRGNLMATEPVGTFGVIGTVVSSLPEGDIHVSVRTVGLDATGANLDGTGNFRGATGEYSSIRLKELARRATFKFNQGLN